MMQRLLFFGAILSAFILLPGSVHAAEFFFGAHGKEAGTNQYIELGVFLNTENASVNAIEGSVTFPSALLLPQEIRKGSSLISFWIEEPHLENGIIKFSGIVPGGYTGTGSLFTLVFKTGDTEGIATLDVKDGKALLHDGSGTPAPLRTAPLALTVGATLRAQEVLPIYDPDAPEAFTPEIAQDSNLFDGKWFVVFGTQDKASGVDHYEIRELSGWRVVINNILAKIFKPIPYQYEKAISPAVLKDQTRKSFVYIKAVDTAGNEKIAIIEPQASASGYEMWWKWSILILSIVIVYFASRIYGGRRRKNTIP